MMRQSETWDHVPREALREWKTRATIAEQAAAAAQARVAELEGLLREAAETVAHYTYGCRYRGDLVDRIRAALAQTGAE